MSEIVVHRSHGLPLAEAKHLAETMADRLRADFGGSYAWEGDTLRFQRTGASAQVVVTAKDIEIRVDISFLLSPLHTRIEREIVAFCDEHLGTPAPPLWARPAQLDASRSGSTRSARSRSGPPSG
jgi:putative polyhydroxyalkanoate system protein